MPKFDEVFAELQAKMSAAIAVIAQYPEVAAQVRQAIETAQSEAEIVEQQAQDDARANALSTVITDVRAVLQEVAPLPSDVVEQPSDAPAPVEPAIDTGPIPPSEEPIEEPAP